MITMGDKDMDVFAYYKEGITQYIWLQSVTAGRARIVEEEDVHSSLAELVAMLQKGSDALWPNGSFIAAVVEGAVRDAENWSIDGPQEMEYLDTG
ncbi:hypothetical protein DFP93_11442 [Aneurinibacillus soli]|uniref:Uncharacterized protein n=1 Tax=Aneurinibacillus soli TaxID=1500254 RepID=A0A0U4NBJ9_9BACL|nr:hypothetical protein [Aneurinibacillus soli]PYE60107.1 hypothetical protein DFP93_11442 [Aneurinibacillus soli]BAU26404.1 hypothetical protein CB4_00531 [Aneurinibacillus soli]